MWETRDAGRTWEPIFDAQPIGTIGALAVAPSDPRVLYVGTGEADMRSDIAQGNGVYRSADGGRTWAHVGLATRSRSAASSSTRGTPNLVYVAALGHPYGPNAERGVFRSSNGGRTWEKVLYRDADTGAIDLAFEPGDPRVIYAALWQTRRPPWSVYPPSNGPGSGLYRSADGGDTLDAGSTATACRPSTAASASRSRPPSRSASTRWSTPSAGGLYRSDDGGAHWTRVASDDRDLAARLVLRRRHGRSAPRRRGLRAQHQPVPLGRRRADASR